MGRIGDYERGGRCRPNGRRQRRRANRIEPWLPLGRLFPGRFFPGRFAPRTWTPNRGGQQRSALPRFLRLLTASARHCSGSVIRHWHARRARGSGCPFSRGYRRRLLVSPSLARFGAARVRNRSSKAASALVPGFGEPFWRTCRMP